MALRGSSFILFFESEKHHLKKQRMTAESQNPVYQDSPGLLPMENVVIGIELQGRRDVESNSFST